MGSPLGPTSDNFFLADVELKLFANLSDINPKYVDNIFESQEGTPNTPARRKQKTRTGLWGEGVVMFVSSGRAIT